MLLRPEQLAAHLEKPLAPLYLLHGDEPLLVIEAGDAIRAAANADAAGMLGRLLEMDDFDVVISLEARTALHLVQTGTVTPDVFILDIGMPDMDGYALARKLREDPHLQNARLIALTGYGQESDRARSAEAGFDHHLVKPVSYQQLKELLSNIDTELLTAV